MSQKIVAPETIKVTGSDITTIQNSFNTDGWTGSYSFQTGGVNSDGKLIMKGILQFIQQITYSPNSTNAEDNLTVLIGPENNPKLEKFKIVSLDQENTLTLVSIKNESEMKDKDIASIEISDNKPLKVTYKDGTTDDIASGWYGSVKITHPSSRIGAGENQSYTINVGFSVWVDGAARDLADSIKLPINDVFLTFAFPNSSKIRISSEGAHEFSVMTDDSGKIKVTAKPNLHLSAVDENDKPSERYLNATTGTSRVTATDVRINMVSSAPGYSRWLFTRDNQTWYNANAPVYVSKDGGVWKEFVASGGFIYGLATNGFTLKTDDSTTYLLGFNPRADTSKSTEPFEFGSMLGQFDKMFFNGVKMRSAYHDGWYLKIVNSTQAELLLNVPDYVNPVFSAPDTITVQTDVPNLLKMPTGVLSAFPNPAQDHITLVLNEEKPTKTWLNIYNSMGIPVMQVLRGEMVDGYSQYDVDIHNLPAGAYFARYGGQNNATSKTVPFVKE